MNAISVMLKSIRDVGKDWKRGLSHLRKGQKPEVTDGGNWRSGPMLGRFVSDKALLPVPLPKPVFQGQKAVMYVKN